MEQRQRLIGAGLWGLWLVTLVVLGVVAWTGSRIVAAPPAPVMGAMQTSEIIGPTDAIGFDYINTDYQNSQVNRFEASYDGSAYGPLTVSVYQNVNGVTTWRFVPPQTSGTHTVAVRACNSVECGGSTPPFGFAFAVVNPPTPNAPTNMRKVPRN